MNNPLDWNWGVAFWVASFVLAIATFHYNSLSLGLLACVAWIAGCVCPGR